MEDTVSLAAAGIKPAPIGATADPNNSISPGGTKS